ncbi:MAG: hypothetical protein QF415_08875 [Candidatus Undinarchaeales archaeon]|nr:hypothetical protein [Candidatus Undinarchaeales archaeon]MDP7494110.1 hypothetical protein [Candidatus Undinarchaeales archaeon]
MLERDCVFTTLRHLLHQNGRLTYTEAVNAVFGHRLSSSSPGYLELRPFYDQFVREMSLCRGRRSKGRLVFVPLSAKKRGRSPRYARRVKRDEAAYTKLDKVLARDGKLTYKAAIKAVYGRNLPSTHRRYLSFASVYRRFVRSRELVKIRESSRRAYYVPKGTVLPKERPRKAVIPRRELPAPPVPYPIIRELFTHGMRTGVILAEDIDPDVRPQVLTYIRDNVLLLLRRVHAPFHGVDTTLKPDRLLLVPRDELSILTESSRASGTSGRATTTLSANLGNKRVGRLIAAIQDDCGFIESAIMEMDGPLAQEASARLVERCEHHFTKKGIAKVFAHVPARGMLTTVLREHRYRIRTTLHNYIGNRTWHVFYKRLSPESVAKKDT